MKTPELEERVKTVDIEIGNARSLEHAMDKAVDKARDTVYGREGNFGETLQLIKVTFKKLEYFKNLARPDYFVYTFTAYFEEL